VGIENPVHLLFIAVVALLVLGPKRLPDLARAVGKGVREFREAMSLGESESPPPSLPPPASPAVAPQPAQQQEPAPAPPPAPLPQSAAVQPPAPGQQQAPDE